MNKDKLLNKRDKIDDKIIAINSKIAKLIEKRSVFSKELANIEWAIYRDEKK